MLEGLFRGKQKYVTIKPAGVKREVPDGLWTKCPSCNQILYNKELVNNLKVCRKCGFHFKMSSRERLDLIVDDGSFVEYDFDLLSGNPLDFPGYQDKLEKAVEVTGLQEAIVTGIGTIGGYRVSLGIMDFAFIGASMGSVVGEKVARAFERALNQGIPAVMVCCSGGARMQEGILSLMQMAKTAATVAKLNEAGILYISVLTDPTTAGVFASFASLGDIVLAEPRAQIGFAGPRVIEETIRQKLPPGFQSAEFVLSHGFVDRIVERKDLKKSLVQLLSLHERDGWGVKGGSAVSSPA